MATTVRFSDLFWRRSLPLLLFMFVHQFIIPISVQSYTMVNKTPRTTMITLRCQVVDLQLMGEDQAMIRFKLKLRLNIVNNGIKPVILLKQSFKIGAEMLARSYEEAESATYILKRTHWPSVSAAPEWDSWRRHLDTPTPPQELVDILLPNESLSLEVPVALLIEKAGSFDLMNKGWDEIRQSSPLWLQIEVLLWPANLESTLKPRNNEFGKILRQRWQSFGELQLDHLRSEPMQLTFSDIK